MFRRLKPSKVECLVVIKENRSKIESFKKQTTYKLIGSSENGFKLIETSTEKIDADNSIDQEQVQNERSRTFDEDRAMDNEDVSFDDYSDSEFESDLESDED